MTKYYARIKELRKEKNLTQAQLAADLGIKSPSTLRMWELGINEPSIDVLVSLAKYFHVSIDYLVGHSDERQNSYTSYIETKLMSDTSKSYISLMGQLGTTLISMELNPLISHTRIPGYLSILKHDINILKWLSEKPTTSENIRHYIKHYGDDASIELWANRTAVDMNIAMQQIEIKNSEHINLLKQLLLNNHTTALKYLETHIQNNPNDVIPTKD